MNIIKKKTPLDWMCQHGQMSPGTLASVAGLLPTASELLLPVSSWELLPGPRLCLQLLVCGVWDVCGWLFCILVLFSALCRSNSGTVFYAQMFYGFQEKRFENLPSQRDS